ncbi:MAG: diphthine--ammonia ligase [Bacteroidota bacterium]
MSRPKAFMNWSSGKDATMALYTILQEQQYAVEKLLTTVNSKYNRVSMHGLHRSLLEAQAKAIEIPLDVLEVGENPTMEDYNRLMSNKLTQLRMEGFGHSIYGDIFLEDLRAYREKINNELGIASVFPLWKKDTRQLLLDFIAQGYQAIVVCCNAQLLHRSFCGRLIDRQFLEDLPEGVDPCGENGEFHTFCFDSPLFRQPIAFTKGEVVYRTYPAPKSEDKEAPAEYGFWYCDLTLN